MSCTGIPNGTGSGEREERDTKKCGFQGKDFGRGANMTRGRGVLLSLNRPRFFYKNEPCKRKEFELINPRIYS